MDDIDINVLDDNLNAAAFARAEESNRRYMRQNCLDYAIRTGKTDTDEVLTAAKKFMRFVYGLED